MAKELDAAPSTERALDASNRGYRLLLKMGWRCGRGLGKREQGIVEPVKMKENLVTLGLGKAEELDEVAQLATSERRKLETEVQETAQQVAAREAKAARETQIQEQVRDMQRAFHCAPCRKQYTTVTEMENHLSSYDHHHTKRLRELQQQKRKTGSQLELSAKRKKEQQQEELMLQRRIAKVAQSNEAKQPRSVACTDAGNTEADRPETSAASRTVATKVGFSFGGGMRMGAKKPAKKALSGRNVPSAFANPFSQQ